MERNVNLNCETCEEIHVGTFSHINNGQKVYNVEGECKHYDYLTDEVATTEQATNHMVTAEELGLTLKK